MLKKIINFIFYLLSLIFFILAIVTIQMDFEKYMFTGIMFMIISVVSLPVLSNKLLKKKNIHFIKFAGVKILCIVIMFFSAFIFVPGSSNSVETISDSFDNLDNENSNEKACTSVILVYDGENLDLDKLSCYIFAHPFVELLDELGINDITNIQVRTNSNDKYFLEINTETHLLYSRIEKDKNNNSWEVQEIIDGENKDIYYYCIDNYLDSQKEIIKNDIYSYTTGNIVVYADKDKISEYNKEQLQLEKEKEENEIKRIREQSEKDFLNIFEAYQNNELAADEKYKGKKYTIVGTFQGASDNGIFNKVLNEVTVKISVEYNNTLYYLDCSFDKKWAEQLMEYNQGDEIIFVGQCYSWGVWKDCEIVSV